MHLGLKLFFCILANIFFTFIVIVHPYHNLLINIITAHNLHITKKQYSSLIKHNSLINTIKHRHDNYVILMTYFHIMILLLKNKLMVKYLTPAVITVLGNNVRQCGCDSYTGFTSPGPDLVFLLLYCIIVLLHIVYSVSNAMSACKQYECFTLNIKLFSPAGLGGFFDRYTSPLMVNGLSMYFKLKCIVLLCVIYFHNIGMTMRLEKERHKKTVLAKLFLLFNYHCLWNISCKLIKIQF